MSKGARIREILTNEEYDGILYEDMDEAILGVFRDRLNNTMPVYSYVKYVEILVKRGMSEEAASECADDHISSAKGSLVPAAVINLRILSQPIIIDDTGV
jgi:hypothetical protein